MIVRPAKSSGPSIYLLSAGRQTELPVLCLSMSHRPSSSLVHFFVFLSQSYSPSSLYIPHQTLSLCVYCTQSKESHMREPGSLCDGSRGHTHHSALADICSLSIEEGKAMTLLRAIHHPPLRLCARYRLSFNFLEVR